MALVAAGAGAIFGIAASALQLGVVQALFAGFVALAIVICVTVPLVFRPGIGSTHDEPVQTVRKREIGSDKAWLRREGRRFEEMLVILAWLPAPLRAVLALVGIVLLIGLVVASIRYPAIATLIAALAASLVALAAVARTRD